MSRSSPPAGSFSRDNLRRALGASPHDLMSHGIMPTAHSLQVPAIGMTYTDDQNLNHEFFNSSPSETMHNGNNGYGLQVPNSTHNIMRLAGTQYSGSRSGSYGSFEHQYSVNQLNSPLYQDNADNIFAQEVEQANLSQNYVENDAASESESGDSGSNPQVFQATIRNEEHYHQTMARRHRAGSQNGQANDIPESEEEMRAMVKELFESIIDTSNVVDKPSKDGKPAQAVRRFRSGFYGSKHIEMKCWEIVLRCRDATLGLRLPGLDSKAKREEYEGFHARFNKIIESCKTSKALCKQIMDPTYISRLVAAPGTEIQMKFNNKKINAERDIQNEIGRKAVKRGIKLNDLDRLIDADAAPPLSPIDPALADIQNQQQIVTGTPELDVVAGLELGGEPSALVEVKGPKKGPNTPKTPKNTTVQKNAAYKVSIPKVSSSKRKVGSSKVPNGQTNSDDNESGSEYEESPAKRQRSTMNVQSRATPTKRRGSGKRRAVDSTIPSAPNNVPSAPATTLTGPLMAGTAGMTLASSPTPALPQATGNYSSDNTPASSALENYPAGNSLFVLEDDENEDSGPSLEEEMEAAIANGTMFTDSLEMHYKSLICRLLGISEIQGNKYALRDLRTYAHAYNDEFVTSPWSYGPELSGLGFVLFRNGIVHSSHFAQALPLFQELAICRGDLTKTGGIPDSKGLINSFPIQTNYELRQALGIEENQFGPHIF